MRRFSSCSAAAPRSVKRCTVSTASCRGGGGGYPGLGRFGRSRSGNATKPVAVACRDAAPAPRVGLGYGGAGFGCRVGRGPTPTAKATGNERLLRPLKLGMHPDLQPVKYQEKEQTKTLNNTLALFIDKVQFLKQQNKVLETKWGFLQEQKCCRSNTEPMFETYIGNVKRQLHVLGSEAKLEPELSNMHGIVEEYKKKYEGETHWQKRAENEFVTLKKDCAYVNKAELEAKVESLIQEINCPRSLCEVYKEPREITGKYDDSLRNTKNEIVELNRVIQRPTGECENTKAQSKGAIKPVLMKYMSAAQLYDLPVIQSTD
ncbi:LOW QUALITY PROTEIN: keratin, type II cytoskeletal cochleal-like [Phoenicopterus ruber ruber]